MPENSVIQHASQQDYKAFYHQEVESRKAFGFPPYNRLIKFLFSGEIETVVAESAARCHSAFAELLPSSCVCHPVMAAGHAKVKDQFRFHFFIRTPQLSAVRQALEQLDQRQLLPSGVVRYIDVDPLSVFF